MVSFFSLLPKKERVLLYIAWSVRLAVLIVLILSVHRRNYLTMVFAVLVLGVSFIPAMIARRFSIILPPEFEVLFVLFLYGSFVLGEFKDYYARFWWWDVMLHGFSAMMFALLGFMIIYSLYNAHKVVFAPVFASIFSFSFALALGAVWEIVEFTMDQNFGMNMQKSGLLDTMWDLIVDSLGALFVSVLGYVYIKGGDSLIMERFVKKFIDLNDARLKK